MSHWNTLYEGLLSIRFLMECNDLPEKYGREARKIPAVDIHLDTCGEGHRLLNPAVLMMAAYLFFVYIKEIEGDIDLTDVPTDGFDIEEAENPHDEKRLLQRLRNSISHGNYEIDNGNEDIVFEDFKPNGKRDYIRIRIGFKEFAWFIEKFKDEVIRQKFPQS